MAAKKKAAMKKAEKAAGVTMKDVRNQAITLFGSEARVAWDPDASALSVSTSDKEVYIKGVKRTPAISAMHTTLQALA